LLLAAQLANSVYRLYHSIMQARDPISRRDALRTIGAGAALLGLGVTWVRAQTPAAGTAAADPQPFTLPGLGYAYDALEPHIDARTMEIHHTKHHQAYITNANKALSSYPDLHGLNAETLLRQLDSVPAAIRTTVRNNVGGHHNHALFWRVIGPQGGGVPAGRLAAAINRDFGSMDVFKAQFADAAIKRFGSGWAWLSLKEGTLIVHSTANQDSPLLEAATPLLGLDVWEHAYYLYYQNRRADYAAAFWNLVNWPQVQANLDAATGT
jgi:Fe-Mn family superoxide dismutase